MILYRWVEYFLDVIFLSIKNTILSSFSRGITNMWVVYSRSPTGSHRRYEDLQLKNIFQNNDEILWQNYLLPSSFSTWWTFNTREKWFTISSKGNHFLCIFKILLDSFLICTEQYNTLWFLLGLRLVVLCLYEEMN